MECVYLEIILGFLVESPGCTSVQFVRMQEGDDVVLSLIK